MAPGGNTPRSGPLRAFFHAKPHARLLPGGLPSIRCLSTLDTLLRELLGPEGNDPQHVVEVFDQLEDAVVPCDSPRFLSVIPAAPTSAALLFDMVVPCSSIQGTSWLLEILHRPAVPSDRGSDEAGPWNPSDYAIHLTRQARGLPLWFSFAVHGADAYRDAVETVLQTARQSAELIRATPYLSLLREPELAVVIFSRHGWSRADYEVWSSELMTSQTGFVTPLPEKAGPLAAWPSSTQTPRSKWWRRSCPPWAELQPGGRRPSSRGRPADGPVRRRGVAVATPFPTAERGSPGTQSPRRGRMAGTPPPHPCLPKAAPWLSGVRRPAAGRKSR